MMKYTDSHEWIRVDGKIGTVGITCHGREELGEIVYVELPKLNQRLQKGKEAAVLESTKAAADIYSPVSGKVIERGDPLQSINQFPEGEGWLFKIELENLADLDALMGREEYLELVK